MIRIARPIAMPYSFMLIVVNSKSAASAVESFFSGLLFGIIFAIYFLLDENDGIFGYWRKAFTLIFGELEALDITWETAAEGNANLRRPTPKPGVYTEFGDVRDTGAFFDHEATGKVNRGKYWFNRLPSGMRRTIKKEIKVLKHKN